MGGGGGGGLKEPRAYGKERKREKQKNLKKKANTAKSKFLRTREKKFLTKLPNSERITNKNRQLFLSLCFYSCKV